MPKVLNIPAALKPYTFHGIEDLDYEGRDQAIATCPFCGKEKKFYINSADGRWQCKSCSAGTEKGGGNVYTFMRVLWEMSKEATTDDEYDGLREDRKLLHIDTLKRWGVVKSTLTGDWLVPGHGLDGEVNQLYKYVGKILLTTTGIGHQLHGVPLCDEASQVRYIAEGPWDGMAWWETLREAKLLGRGQKADVVAVPGCGVFNEKWVEFFAGKTVVMLYDSDHPRQNQGRESIPGYDGMRRAGRLLASRSEESGAPREIRYLHWGEKGFNPELPDGFDVRDQLAQGETAEERVDLLYQTLERVQDAPKEWMRKDVAVTAGGDAVDCLPCHDWPTLTASWRKAMRWTTGLDNALAVMLASVVSTRSIGDQLWIKIIGPAACGKSTLCEAVSVNRKFVLAKSTIRGFHSGFKSDAKGEEDNSLVAQLRGKTLVTKDGDTLLQSPNLGQILSEARDLYDSTSRTHYRNKMGKDYQGVRMTWILCGTASLRSIDSSELGERFLDCVIMEGIDDDLEDEISWRVANRAKRNVSVIADGKLETQHDTDLVRAMQLTGGYINYLCDNSASLLGKIDFDDDRTRSCARLAKFVAYMRARPSIKQEESAEREFSSRLTSQLVRLAMCVAAVLGKRDVDDEVMTRTRKVALDTARGRTLELCKHLHKAGSDGLDTRALAIYTNQTEDREAALLRFLRKIGAVEMFRKEANGIKGKSRWRLTGKLWRLYEEVLP